MYLGINAFVHDASAAIVDEDGKIIAAVEEERFTRKKQESRFPIESIKYCLKEAGVTINELDGVGFGWNPKLFLFQRIIWNGWFRFPASTSARMDNWMVLKQMQAVPSTLKELFGFDASKVSFRYFRHHACHAASAYYASPFEHAAFLTLDGQGEAEAITWGTCKGGGIKKLGQGYLPNSIGKVHSATCRFLGFYGAEKNGTAMALAAFGQPRYIDIFRKIIKPAENEKSLAIKVDASYFDFASTAETVMASSKFQEAFGVPPRKTEDEITQTHKDIAASLQQRTEEIIIELLKRLHNITGETNLVLSGGVALNSVLNGKIERISAFEDVFIQPAASDAGLSLGAAYMLAQEHRSSSKLSYPMESVALGPMFSNEEYKAALGASNLSYEKLMEKDLIQKTAQFLADGKVVAWFQGRLEFGPRALGHRSLLGDARRKDMTDLLNKVKRREKFRPFAISILKEKASLVLENITDSPFMLMVDTVKSDWREKIPSAEHIDRSVRIQTLTQAGDGAYYDLVKEFDRLTGVPLIINTSLNVKGEPIVCSPQEAINTFKESEIDVLVLGNYLVKK
jgi:carbamoyltransferase